MSRACSACGLRFWGRIWGTLSDVFYTRAVASVSGLSGTSAGIGTLISTYLIGYVTDRYSFQPVIMAASVIPCLAVAVMAALVRARKTPDPDGLVLNF